MPRKPTAKQLSKIAEITVADAFRVYGNQVPVDIFDVGKILDAGRNAFVNSLGMGEDIDTARAYADIAVKEAVQKYRKDGARVAP